MFVNQVNSLNCKKPCKTNFLANPSEAERLAGKVADNRQVKKAKSWLDKFVDFISDVPSSNKDYDDTFAPGGAFDSDRINYP